MVEPPASCQSLVVSLGYKEDHHNCPQLCLFINLITCLTTDVSIHHKSQLYEYYESEWVRRLLPPMAAPEILRSSETLVAADCRLAQLDELSWRKWLVVSVCLNLVGWYIYCIYIIIYIYIYMLWSIMYILYTYAITCAHGVALNNSKVGIRDDDPYCPFFLHFVYSLAETWSILFSVNIETNNNSLGQLWDIPMHVLIADSACLALQDARWNFQLSRRESRRQSSLRRSQFWHTRQSGSGQKLENSLVVWNIFYCTFRYIGNNGPNWRTHIFQRGR